MPEFIEDTNTVVIEVRDDPAPVILEIDADVEYLLIEDVADTFVNLVEGEGARGPAGPAGPLLARETRVLSTSSLAADASENLDVAIYKAAEIYVLSTNRPAWVRAYATSTYRTDDAARLITEDPEGDHGLLLEMVTASDELSFTLSPVTTVFNANGTPTTTIYFRVTNLDTVTGIVTTTLTCRQVE